MKLNTAALLLTALTLVPRTAIPALADEPAAPVIAAENNPEPGPPLPLDQVLQRLDKVPKQALLTLDPAHAYPVDPEHPEDTLTTHGHSYGEGLRLGDHGPFSLTDVIRGYDRMIFHAGNVTVLAPAHMVVLNTNPGKPDLYEGTRPDEALRLLLGTLTKEQWAALDSKQGLAATELDPAQQHLMLHVFGGHGKIIMIGVSPGPGSRLTDQKHIDITDKLEHMHIRLVRYVNVSIPVGRGPSTGGYQGGPPPAYFIGYDAATASSNGQLVRAVVPATLKPADVDYHDPLWDSSITVQNGTTLGQLIAALGVASHTDIYCDARMEPLPFTLVPAAAIHARVGDLLQAAALCVSGSFRKVGTAYVLTNDTEGLGTRVQKLVQYAAAAERQRHKLLDTASDAFVTKHPLSDVPFEDDASLAITDAQWKRETEARPAWDINQRSIALPFNGLTPAQQARARAVYDDIKSQAQAGTGDVNESPSLTGTIHVWEDADLFATMDGIDGNIMFDGTAHIHDLFRMSGRASRAKAQTVMAQIAAEPQANRVKQPSLSEVLTRIPQRAIIMHVSTAEQLPSIIQSMQRVGLNELWLDVFSSGVSHVMVPDSTHGTTNLIARAVRLGAAAGIRVYAVANLYQWGPATPGDFAERTILGETWAEAQQHNPDNPIPDITSLPVYVTPSHPDVACALSTLHKQLGAVPGLAGLVWLATEPPGYEGRFAPVALGYNVSQRALFLKKQHVDPIDIVPNMFPGADISMPFIDGDWQTRQKVDDSWHAFLKEQNVAALTALRAIALPGSSPDKKPLFVQERRGDGWQTWFGTWDSATAPLPSMHHNWDDPGSSGPDYPEDPLKQAKAQSRVALKFIVSQPGDTAAASMRDYAQDVAGTNWDGIVFQPPIDPTAPFESSAAADAAWLAALIAPDPNTAKQAVAP